MQTVTLPDECTVGSGVDFLMACPLTVDTEGPVRPQRSKPYIEDGRPEYEEPPADWEYRTE